MSSNIHPSSIIQDGAQIGADVKIGPFCVVGAHVKLGDGVVLKSHVVVDGYTTIGAKTVIHPFASIGGAPQDLKYAGEPSTLEIGEGNVIREHVTMNPGTKDGAMKTIIGNYGLFMMGAHIAHDCVVGDHVILANNATLAGHVVLGDHAIIGGLSAIHQFVRIGHHAIIGGMSGVEADVIPFGRVKGERASLAGLNLIGLQRRGFVKADIQVIQKVFQRLFDDSKDSGTMDSRIENLANEFQDNDLIMQVIDFARKKDKFPLCSPPRKK